MKVNHSLGKPENSSKRTGRTLQQILRKEFSRKSSRRNEKLKKNPQTHQELKKMRPGNRIPLFACVNARP